MTEEEKDEVMVDEDEASETNSSEDLAAQKMAEEYSAWVEDTVPVMYGFANSTKFEAIDNLFDICWAPWEGDEVPEPTRYVGNMLGRPSTLILGGNSGIHISETVIPNSFQSGLHGGDPRKSGYDHSRAITKLLHTIPLPSPAERVTLMPQKNKVVAVKEQKGPIHIYSNLSNTDPSGGPMVTLQGHEGQGFGLEYSPFKEGILASGGWDGKVKIWDTASKEQINMFTSEKEIGAVSWSRTSPDVLASTGDDNFISLWDAREGNKAPLQQTTVLPSSSSEYFCVTTIAFLPQTSSTYGSYIATGLYFYFNNKST